MKRTRVGLIGLLLGIGGCETATPPEGDQLVRLDVVISDDPETKFALGEVPAVRLAHHKTFGPNYFHGRLNGELQLAISRNGRDWIALGPPAAVDLPLQEEGETTALHPAVEVRAGTYGYLRLTGVAGAARLDPGAEVAGETLASPVTLELGEVGGLVVETRLASPIFLAAGSRVTLSIDLNAEGWVSEENVEAGCIPTTDIEAALSATPHQHLPAAVVPPRGGRL